MNRVVGLVQDFLGPVFAALLGSGSFDEFFFSRILLLVMIFSIVFISLGKIALFEDKKNTFAKYIVSAVVSLFAVRFMAESELVKMILLPYGVFGVALAVLVPFLIYFFFVHNAIVSGAGRRIAWTIFAAVFFGLWYARADQFGEYSWIYWLGIIGVAISFLFDEKIHDYFGRKEARDARNSRLDGELTAIEDNIQEASRVLANSPNNKPAQRHLLALERRRDELVRQRHRA
jgi:hypothetical protein